MPPVTAYHYHYLPHNVDTTRPGTPELLTLGGRLESYRHSITAYGGEESCTLQYSAEPRAVMAWLQLAGGRTIVYDRHAMRVFDGTVETVEVHDGARSQSLTTAGMANAVRVMYTRNGKQAATSRAVNTTSTARYFTRELLHSGGDMTTTQAETTRDQLLSELAFPREDVVRGLTTQPSRGQASVTVTARGWTQALGWAHYDLPPRSKTGTTNSNALVNDVVNDTIGSPSPSTYGNTIFLVPSIDGQTSTFTGPAVDSGTGPALGLDFPVTRGYETAMAVLQRTIERGDTSGDRVAWGFNLALPIEYVVVRPLFYARVWAGNAPDTAHYYLRAPNTILGAALTPVPWTQVRPDTMAYDLDAPVMPPRPGASIDTGARRYVARVEYDWRRGGGETLALEPDANTGDPATVLARVR